MNSYTNERGRPLDNPFHNPRLPDEPLLRGCDIAYAHGIWTADGSLVNHDGKEEECRICHPKEMK